MPAISGSAPGKIILFGEHAVVYGHPAIAAPIHQVSTVTHITARPASHDQQVVIDAPVIHLLTNLEDLNEDHPIKQIINAVTHRLNVDHVPPARIRITSTIPLAAGMGSSAATSVSLTRALSTFLGHPLSDTEINQVAFEIEKLHHGTPSGIDNTVITFARPIYFLKGRPVTQVKVNQPLTLVIADSGISSPTYVVVNDVHDHWQMDPARYENLFNQIADTTIAARSAIENGDLASLGGLMRRNHELLQQIQVSCPELDRLVDTAMRFGALGAKLSGGGRGGNMIALAQDESTAHAIAEKLASAGATRTIITVIPAGS